MGTVSQGLTTVNRGCEDGKSGGGVRTLSRGSEDSMPGDWGSEDGKSEE